MARMHTADLMNQAFFKEDMHILGMWDDVGAKVKDGWNEDKTTIWKMLQAKFRRHHKKLWHILMVNKACLA